MINVVLICFGATLGVVEEREITEGEAENFAEKNVEEATEENETETTGILSCSSDFVHFVSR